MKTIYVVLTDSWCSLKPNKEISIEVNLEKIDSNDIIKKNSNILQEKYEIDPIFTHLEAASLEKNFKVNWLIFAKNQQDGIDQRSLFSSVLKGSDNPIVLLEKNTFEVKENPKDCFFVGNNFSKIFSNLILDWSSLDLATQLIYLSNSLGGEARQLEADKTFFDLHLPTRAKIYSLYQLESKLTFLTLLQVNPELWNSDDIIKIGGVFKSKKFFKMIKRSGLFVDKLPFFYVSLDPYNEEEYDLNIVIYKLTDDKATEKLIEAKKECERLGKPVLFPNPPELSSSFRNRVLNVQLLHKVIENESFKEKFEAFSQNHPELKGKKFLVPPTISIKPSEVDQKVNTDKKGD